MNTFFKLSALMAVFLLTGCAHLDFGPDQGLTYYDPKPYFLVSTQENCLTTGTLLMLPGEKRAVRFVSGYGSANYTVNLSNGMITSVTQNTDTKVPETLTAVAGLATAVGGLMMEKRVGEEKPERKEGGGCTPVAVLYPIENGIPTTPISFPVDPAK